MFGVFLVNTLMFLSFKTSAIIENTFLNVHRTHVKKLRNKPDPFPITKEKSQIPAVPEEEGERDCYVSREIK